ncbi:DUF3817 domain-containing protein [Flavobacterium columnare NBRC 100251 = ATCC 23463]|uniref:DUF3817 domain-containing protein n=2 Tax=Flavobacterium columnare TaxID=996 RepID=G8X4I0_FLACA|nr:DUF3817 domain-containing protein [Flavobacterium columnare]AEW85405.1 hypothetical protein FCOL_02800 [Flavobacterium columnare ATCC 49512]AMO19730.1 DUF3817 domain-containing protein [Flavobacterium columnare]APT23162.1 hypothetical protein BU993_11375 [Flavobacterium columnare]AUX17660.1 hypothetical protein AQ623_04770 [Flavobacterium columnare]MBF6652374.1 DUF3817 domain-containing protein [Flavobacterium columnare]
MFKFFRNIALLEGVSYIVIMLNMLMIKPFDLALYKLLLFPVGMSHGVLFILYVLLAFLLQRQLKWNLKTTVIILLASLIPFGTFYIEKKYLK